MRSEMNTYQRRERIYAVKLPYNTTIKTGDGTEETGAAGDYLVWDNPANGWPTVSSPCRIVRATDFEREWEPAAVAPQLKPIEPPGSMAPSQWQTVGNARPPRTLTNMETARWW